MHTFCQHSTTQHTRTHVSPLHLCRLPVLVLIRPLHAQRAGDHQVAVQARAGLRAERQGHSGGRAGSGARAE